MRTFRRSLALVAFAAALIAPGAFAQEADLSVLKSGPAEAAAGTDVTYNVTVTNDGPDDAANPTLSDPIPAGMTFVSGIHPASFPCSYPPTGSGGTINCTAASLAAGSSAAFTFVFNIPLATAPGTFFVNIATATTGTFDPNDENNSGLAITSTPPPQQSDMGIQKNGPSSAGPDTDVTYTISVVNAGPDDASNVTWTDTLPGTMTFVSLVQNSGPAMTCNAATPVTCSAATFPAGATATFTLTGHIPAGTSSGTVYSNTATVSTTPVDSDPSPNNNSATTSVTVSAVDLSVVKAGPGSALAGTNVSYTLTVANAGPDAAGGVTLTDALPADTTFESLTQNNGPLASCGTPPMGSNGTVNCNFVVFASGASAEFTLTINTGSATSYTNTASVTSDSSDADPSNDSSDAPTTVTQSADVGVDKSGPAVVSAGSSATYTVVVTNDGPSNASSVTMTDTPPAGTTFVSVNQTAGPTFSCNVPAGTITCSIATLTAGASATFSIVLAVDVNAPGSFINTADVSSTTVDPNGGNAGSSVQTSVTQSADVAVSKSGPATVNAGSNVTYTVVVTNNGPSNAASVSMTDTTPPQTTFVSVDQTSGPTFSCGGPAVGGTGTITCSIATLAPGASASFSIVLAIDPAATGSITNTANVASTTADPTPGNASSNATAPVTPLAPDVSIVKTANASTFPPGANATFTIVVTNEGLVTATGAEVTDVLPAGTTFFSVSSTQGTCVGTSTVICTVGTLAPAASATITLVVTLPQTLGPVSNTATVTITNGDANPANDSSTATIAVAAVVPIPTLSTLMLALMAIAFAGVVVYLLR